MADDGFPPEEAGGARSYKRPGGGDPHSGISDASRRSSASGTSDASGTGDAAGTSGRGPRGRAPRERPGLGLLARAGHLEYDRVVFFSDAIFAIAITLLVIDIRLPGPKEDAAALLSDPQSGIYSFVISFAVIGLFWMGHHSLFRYITVLDRPLIAINLAFLGTIAFLPYPTALLGRSHGPSAVAVVFYSACISLAGLGELAIWIYASVVRDLVVPGTSLAFRRYVLLRVLRVPAVFLVSIPVALVSASLGAYVWILIVPVGIAVNRYARPERDTQPADPAG